MLVDVLSQRVALVVIVDVEDVLVVLVGVVLVLMVLVDVEDVVLVVAISTARTGPFNWSFPLPATPVPATLRQGRAAHGVLNILLSSSHHSL